MKPQSHKVFAVLNHAHGCTEIHVYLHRCSQSDVGELFITIQKLFF
jgi:hypothetical protein